MIRDIKIMCDEELIEYYWAERRYLATLTDASDGDYWAEYYVEFLPIEKEIKERGLCVDEG